MAGIEHCSWCNGTGKQTCKRCKGSGEVPGRNNPNKKYTCIECGGSGQTDCDMCNGVGYTQK